MQEIEPLLTETQLRLVIPISRRELDRWRKEGCPSIKKRRRRFYEATAVKKWVIQKWGDGDWLPEQ
jgi:hypothetical protein